VVSGREYKKTSRGIDIITTYLAEKGYFVDHLVFFRRTHITEKQINSNIRQLYFYDCLGIYRDKMRSFIPGFLLRFYFSYIIKNQKQIDFSVYDWVILESGYPAYFSLVLTNKIIYRLSDPAEIAFNCNRHFYRKLELNTLEKSLFISSAIPETFYPSKYSLKFAFWHSGFIPITSAEDSQIKKEFVFMGGGEIDLPLIEKISNRFPDYIFHIIGSFRLKKPVNDKIIFHGYLEYDEYQKLIPCSSVCIIPFTKRFSYQLRRCHFTAKILLAMSLGMPILLKNYGSIQNTDNDKKLFVYKTHNEALDLLSDIINKIENGELKREVSKETQNFLFSQTAENRLKELDKTFSEWIK
jgi:glycosyltransferase involved in cell wall biosynthesis